ncbi:fimbrial protein [Salmonella enterica subsp. enterica serovar Brandenburg]|nr:hypothetical protein [Salmonella enterica]EBU8924865.1 hypothetical protein [Salmonella enterica subsp. enterica serovar Nima]EDS7029679.1 fimbrial protein [Salmonella enterica subsp. enterica]EIR7526220.1 fimbrial protein [Salmonella enterica subsp. enterica serovar Brandenburg]EBX3165278.1 hypothetical protein [Salmonella enterica subsp. enterica serovar Nima]
MIGGDDTIADVTAVKKLADGTVIKDMDARETVISQPPGAYPPVLRSILLLKNHGTVTVAVPPELAYGDEGYPPKVPSGATMVYTLRVEDVKAESVSPDEYKNAVASKKQEERKIMILKRSRPARLMTVGLLLVSAQALAMDVPIKITGTIQIPPCLVNEGRRIEVDFGDVSVIDVANKRNQQKVSIPVNCAYAQGHAYVKVTGTQLGSNTNVLATNVKNFGIALYQGEGVSTEMLLGNGQNNGKDSIGYRITTGFTGSNSGTFTFTVVPYKQGNDELTTGGFTASANMNISYF